MLNPGTKDQPLSEKQQQKHNRYVQGTPFTNCLNDGTVPNNISQEDYVLLLIRNVKPSGMYCEKHFTYCVRLNTLRASLMVYILHCKIFNFSIWVEIIRMGNMHFLCHFLAVFMMTWSQNEQS